MAAVDAGAASAPMPDSDHSKPLPLLALGVGLLVASAGAFLLSTPGQALRAALVAGPLGSSGCLAAFSLISLSEIGDKTFFISAILAARIGRAMSFAGSLAALAALTLVNVAIGALCARCPDTLLSRLQLPVAELASIGVLGFFGLRAIREGLKGKKGDPLSSSSSTADFSSSSASSSAPPLPQPLHRAPAPSGHLAAEQQQLEGQRNAVLALSSIDSMSAVSAMADGGRAYSHRGGGTGGTDTSSSGSSISSGSRSRLAVFFEVASLIFQAEWGDRSMLATIALASAHSPVGVAVGAVAGHAVATGVAVVGGAIAGKYISERAINLISGVLFLVFAAATAFSLL
ncbi:hypothetical protein HYH02_003512 [Chlamydomonas schloesseri]|uniref:GDT1 family protein n=1 Tax=Chlamydomonas schloesseri TaxID=2026947 RepID=A0A836B9F9_9CHLO|nr:hypothetical protein HYH02_003512 [Chlamydomonas schloesseri]|eukprot:KAG2451732.1 hypothetical protein HYH02_003512 [Chlamydomonas schloesseri]